MPAKKTTDKKESGSQDKNRISKNEGREGVRVADQPASYVEKEEGERGALSIDLTSYGIEERRPSGGRTQSRPARVRDFQAQAFSRLIQGWGSPPQE